MSAAYTDHAQFLLTPPAVAGLFSLMEHPVPPVVMERLSAYDAERSSASPVHIREELTSAGLIGRGESAADLSPAAAEMMAVVAEATVAITIAPASGADSVTAFLLEERTMTLGIEGDSVRLRTLLGDAERQRWLAASLGGSTPCVDAWPFCLDTTPDLLRSALDVGANGDSEVAAAEWGHLGGSPELRTAFVNAAAALSDWAAVTAITTWRGDVSTTRVGVSPHGAWLARVCLQGEEYRAQLAWLPVSVVLDVLRGTRTIRLSA